MIFLRRAKKYMVTNKVENVLLSNSEFLIINKLMFGLQIRSSNCVDVYYNVCCHDYWKAWTWCDNDIYEDINNYSHRFINITRDDRCIETYGYPAYAFYTGPQPLHGFYYYNRKIMYRYYLDISEIKHIDFDCAIVTIID